MKKFYALIITCIISFSLVSADIHPTSLVEQASFFGPMETLVHGRVNALTGAQVCQEIDGTLDSPDPLALTRTYASFKRATDCKGWSVNGYTRMYIKKTSSCETFPINGVQCSPCDLVVEHFLGGTLHFRLFRDVENPAESRKDVAKLSTYKAYASTYAGQASGQTHLGNYKIVYDPETAGYILTTGDGSRLSYLPFKTSPAQSEEVEIYLLSERKFPSGNRCLYTYDQRGCLTKIEVRNAALENLLNQALFSYSEDGSIVKVSLADKRTIIYEYDSRGRLVRCKRADGFESRYAYKGSSHLLIREEMPEGRFVNLLYTQKKDGNFQVAQLTRSCSSGEDTVHFSYSKNGNNLQTTISEPLKKTQLTCLYDSKFKLTELQVADASASPPTLYKSTKYHWKKGLESFLLEAQTVHNAEGNCLLGMLFKYDPNGNLVEHTICGALSGKPNTWVKLDDNCIPIPDEGESYTSYFEYSTDGMNLLTRNGKTSEKSFWSEYTYQDGTNLLKAKTLFGPGSYSYSSPTSIKNEQLEYDLNGALVKRLVQNHKPKEEGREFLYEYQTSMPWCPPAVFIEKSTDGSTDLHTAVTYDPEMHLQEESIYDSQTGDLAYTLRKRYDDAGNITHQTNAIGQEFEYTYNSYGDITRAVQPGIERFYTYDLSGNLIHIKTIYDDGEVEEVSYLFEAPERCIGHIDSLGNSTKQSLDFLGRGVCVTYPAVQDENSTSINPSISFEYDLLDNVTKFVDARGNATDIRRNSYGDPAEITYPDGRKETFKYDPYGTLHRHMAPDKLVRVFAYDPGGRLKEIEYSFAGDYGNTGIIGNRYFEHIGSNLNKDKGDFSEEVNFKYDSASRLSSTFSNDGVKLESYVYDGLRRVQSKKVYSDKDESSFTCVSYEYDPLDRVISKETSSSDGSIQKKLSYSYDSYGNVSSVTTYPNNEPFTIKYDYHPSGRLLKVADPSLGEVCYSHKTTKDPSGQAVSQVEVIFPDGITEQVTYDALGRKIEKLITKERTELKRIKFSYDISGNLCKKTTQPPGSWVDFIRNPTNNNWQIKWSFDSLGQLSSLTDNSNLSTCFSYNELGQLSTKTNPSGNQITFSYSKLGSIKEITAMNSSTGEQLKEAYSFERKRSQLEDIEALRTSPHGKAKVVTCRLHNRSNQIVSEELQLNGKKSKLCFSYDLQGRKKSIALPDGSYICFEYNGSELQSMIRKDKSDKVAYTRKFDTYDLSGRCARIASPGDLGQVSTQYNQKSQREGLTANFLDITSLDAVKFNPSGYIISHLSSGRSTQFSYDQWGQLTKETGCFKNDFEYDFMGNLTRINGETAKYNASNQIMQLGGCEFTHTLDGHLTKEKLGSKEVEYIWDAFGALVEVKKSRYHIKYLYDAYDRCVSKSIHDVRAEVEVLKEEYIYDGLDLIGVLEGEEIKYLKISHPETGEILAIEMNGAAYLPHLDLRGNISQLISIETGDLCASFVHSAFGKCIVLDSEGYEIEEKEWFVPWSYKGKFRDIHTGLINFGRRWYNPKICRWMSPDPLGYIDGDNLYTFCRNNPISFDDLDGLASYEKEQEYIYGDYEERCPCDKHRDCHQGRDLVYSGKYSYEHKPKMRIFFINGIMTTKKEAFLHAQRISSYFGGRTVKVIHSPTSRTDLSLWPLALGIAASKRASEFITDLAVAARGKLGYETEGSRKIKLEMIRFYLQSEPNDRLLLIPHSRGAIETKTALASGLPKCVTDRVITIAVAPGAYIEKGACANSRNFVSPNDIVPMLNMFEKGNADITVVPGKSLLMGDHSFDSPVYDKGLRAEFKGLVNDYASMD
jgi:RHS repeat-associated protein